MPEEKLNDFPKWARPWEKGSKSLPTVGLLRRGCSSNFRQRGRKWHYSNISLMVSNEKAELTSTVSAPTTHQLARTANGRSAACLGVQGKAK